MFSFNHVQSVLRIFSAYVHWYVLANIVVSTAQDFEYFKEYKVEVCFGI